MRTKLIDRPKEEEILMLKKKWFEIKTHKWNGNGCSPTPLSNSNIIGKPIGRWGKYKTSAESRLVDWWHVTEKWIGRQSLVGCCEDRVVCRRLPIVETFLYSSEQFNKKRFWLKLFMFYIIPSLSKRSQVGRQGIPNNSGIPYSVYWRCSKEPSLGERFTMLQKEKKSITSCSKLIENSIVFLLSKFTLFKSFHIHRRINGTDCRVTLY